MKVLGFLTVCLVLASSGTGDGAPDSSWEDEQLKETFLRDLERARATNSGTWICHVNRDTRKGGDPKHNYSVHLNWANCAASCNSTASKQWLGYIGAGIAIVFFGSNFIPVKSYETGDGVFFQWVLCVGIWLVGLVVNFILDSPLFFLPTVLGGFLWCTGNMLVVPIIQMIGMTMGLTVWGVTNMLTGWVVGRFILDQKVACDALNYTGVATVVVSVLILAFVKTEGRSTSSQEAGGRPSERTALLGEKTSSLEGSLRERVCGCCMNLFKLQRSSESPGSPTSINDSSEKVVFGSSILGRGTDTSNETPSHESFVDRLGVWHRRILGFGLSLIAGVMFGCLFLPVQFLKLCDDTLHSHTCDDMSYLFGVYSGILITSTFYMFTYSALTGNRPKVYPKIVFPGLISGILWGIAMAGWFLSNQHLSLAISFPLVTAGPGFVSSLWGILVYREIRGWRNILLFFVAFTVSVTGLVMNGLSKCTVHCNHSHHNSTTTYF